MLVLFAFFFVYVTTLQGWSKSLGSVCFPHGQGRRTPAEQCLRTFRVEQTETFLSCTAWQHVWELRLVTEILQKIHWTEK